MDAHGANSDYLVNRCKFSRRKKLRAALARGQWRSGEMLPGQRELAEQLGISRPSLREAVIVLETLGLVRSMPGKGVVVLEANLSDSQSHDSAVAGASLEDVLQLRYTLEPFIVGLVAQSISSKEVGQLRLTLMDMREALEANDSEAGVNAYIAFHEELFALTSNPIFPERGAADQQRPQTKRRRAAQFTGAFG